LPRPKAQKTAWDKIKSYGEKMLESYPSVIFMSLVTLYTLFLDDIRTIFINKEKDDIFYGITLGCFIIFMIEIIIGATCRQIYFLTFFFWLDLISTFSMLPDIGWFWEVVTGEGSNVQAGNATQLAKTSRAGRVTRVIRVIRLIRLIRIVKLYKQAKLAQKKVEEDEKKIKMEEEKKAIAAFNAKKKASIL
jgi:Ion transport protein